jgi:hypothetical protein
METPNVPIGFVPAKSGETMTAANGIICRILEDGSRTGVALSQDELKYRELKLTVNSDNRVGAAEFSLPAGTRGPPAHWHEMVQPYACPVRLVR